jgi:hypothetical protein
VVLERVALMLASFSNEPVPEGRRVATQAITPDIYAAELAKKGLLERKAKKAAVRKPVRKGKARATVASKPARKTRRR